MANNEVWVKIRADVAEFIKQMRTVSDSVDGMSKKITATGARMGGRLFPQLSGGELATLTAAGNKINSTVDAISGAVVRGVGLATGAVTGFTAAAMSIGGGFEQQMTAVKTVAGASAADLGAMTKRARELGAALPVTAKDVAGAMYSMASSGLKAKDIITSVADVVNTAVAHNYGVQESADLIISTMKSFGLQAKDAAKITDVFTNAVNNSMLNMDKLSYAMRYVGPVASGLGLSLEEVVAAMEALADRGMRGEQIGTSLREIMTALVKPSTEAGKALERLGVQAYDTATGKLRPLQKVFTDLKNAGMTMKDAATIFGTEGSTGAAVLAATAGSLQNYQNKLKALGATQAQVSEQQKTFSNIMKGVRSEIEELFITAFDGIKDKAKNMGDAVKGTISTFNTWAKSTNIIGRSINAFFNGLGGQIGTVDDFKTALGQINVAGVVTKFNQLGQSIRTAATAISEIIGVIPWEWILNHLKAISIAFATVWATDKAVRFAADLHTVGKGVDQLLDKLTGGKGLTAALGGLMALMGNPVIAGLVAAVAGLAVAFGVAKHNANIQKEADASNEASKRLLQTAELYAAAVKGNKEALDLLPDKYRAMAEAAIKAKEAQSGLTAEAQKLPTIPLDIVTENLKVMAHQAYTTGADMYQYIVERIRKLPAAVQGSIRGDMLAGLVLQWQEEFKTAGEKSGADYANGVKKGITTAFYTNKIKIIEDAIKGGFLGNGQLKQANALINQLGQGLKSFTGSNIAGEFAGMNISNGLMAGLKRSAESGALTGNGLQQTKTGQVTVYMNGKMYFKTDEDVKRIGKQIGTSIMTSMYPSY